MRGAEAGTGPVNDAWCVSVLVSPTGTSLIRAPYFAVWDDVDVPDTLLQAEGVWSAYQSPAYRHGSSP